MSVGGVADTAEFAVESTRRWWNQMGRRRFPEATNLMITADAGDSTWASTPTRDWTLDSWGCSVLPTRDHPMLRPTVVRRRLVQFKL